MIYAIVGILAVALVVVVWVVFCLCTLLSFYEGGPIMRGWK